MGIVSTLRTRLAIAALALVSTVAWGDPPTRAIRIANVNGPVSFLPSGESDWTQARVNRPVWTGDRRTQRAFTAWRSFMRNPKGDSTNSRPCRVASIRA